MTPQKALFSRLERLFAFIDHYHYEKTCILFIPVHKYTEAVNERQIKTPAIVEISMIIAIKWKNSYIIGFKSRYP